MDPDNVLSFYKPYGNGAYRVNNHEGEPHECAMSFGIVGNFVEIGKIDGWIEVGREHLVCHDENEFEIHSERDVDYCVW